MRLLVSDHSKWICFRSNAYNLCSGCTEFKYLPEPAVLTVDVVVFLSLFR